MSAPAGAELTAAEPAVVEGRAGLGERLLAIRVQPQHVALAGVLALSAVLNTVRLSQNGYANVFYSAGVKSMLRSLHNFVFVSFDPGGLISVDKPPLGLWLQVASAKIFGFSPLSLLLPEAILGVLAVALLYRLLAPRMGALAGLAGALSLAVFPSFVAVSRENGVDPLLIVLMILACGAGLRAAETGRWRTLLWSAALVGLAFNTKTLAAYLVLPGIALAYAVCAPGSIARRALQLLAAGAMVVAVSFAWMALVELTPASKRPYVGSSTNNTELGLTFEYNGFGRVNGQVGGPGRVPKKPGARVHVPRPKGAGRHVSKQQRGGQAGGVTAKRSGGSDSRTRGGREKEPIPFGGPPRLLRLFGVGLGDQGAWIVPFAAFGLLGLALLGLAARLGGAAWNRRDPRLALTLVMGGWFVVEAGLLSLSKGIVHPYYMSALAPGAAAMAGAGAVAFAQLARGPRRAWALALIPAAVAATVAAQLVLLHREDYLAWFEPVLVAGAGAGIVAVLIARRLAVPAVAALLCLLLVAPTAYSTTTWLAPVQGTFPAAGPKHTAGAGGVGVSRDHLRAYRALLDYARARAPRARWPLFTDAAPTAAPFILLGLDAGSLAGYSGTDPAIDGARLGSLVAAGQARFVVLGGEFSSRGGNKATAAVLRACRLLAPEAWRDPGYSPYGLALFDCAGRERALASS